MIEGLVAINMDGKDLIFSYQNCSMNFRFSCNTESACEDVLQQIKDYLDKV